MNKTALSDISPLQQMIKQNFHDIKELNDSMIQSMEQLIEILPFNNDQVIYINELIKTRKAILDKIGHGLKKLNVDISVLSIDEAMSLLGDCMSIYTEGMAVHKVMTETLFTLIEDRVLKV